MESRAERIWSSQRPVAARSVATPNRARRRPKSLTMKIHCPSCHRQLAAEQVNVATDVAVCPSCDEAFSISALLATGQCVEGFDIHEPPRGAWFEDMETGWRIGASTRKGQRCQEPFS